MRAGPTSIQVAVCYLSQKVFFHRPFSFLAYLQFVHKNVNDKAEKC